MLPLRPRLPLIFDFSCDSIIDAQAPLLLSFALLRARKHTHTHIHTLLAQRPDFFLSPLCLSLSTPLLLLLLERRLYTFFFCSPFFALLFIPLFITGGSREREREKYVCAALRPRYILLTIRTKVASSRVRIFYEVVALLNTRGRERKKSEQHREFV